MYAQAHFLNEVYLLCSLFFLRRCVLGYLTGNTFNFDNQSSDLFNLMMCWDGSSDTEETGFSREILTGETNSLRMVANQYGTIYTQPLQIEFTVVHKNCNEDDYEFTDRESRAIHRWLLKDTYRPLKINDTNTDNIIFNAICTLVQDKIYGGFYGKHLLFACDSPFGYISDITKYINVNGSATFQIINSSDNGQYYPKWTLTCDKTYNGEVAIQNITQGITITYDMANIPIVGNQKILNIDSGHMFITDGNENIIPLYKLGWSVSDKIDQMQLIRFPSLAEGINIVQIIGTCRVKLICAFARLCGVV